MSQPPSLNVWDVQKNQKNWSDDAASQALSRICRILCHRLARIMLAALAFGPVHRSCQEMERLIRKMRVFAAAANNNHDMMGTVDYPWID